MIAINPLGVTLVVSRHVFRANNQLERCQHFTGLKGNRDGFESYGVCDP